MSRAPADSPQTVLIAAKVDEGFAREVRAVAVAEDRSVSALIKRSLRQYIAVRRADA